MPTTCTEPHRSSVVHLSKGRMTPCSCPVKRPFAESPSPGSWTWNETASLQPACGCSFGAPIETTPTSTVIKPSLRRFGGIHAVEVYCPGARIFPVRVRVQRVEDDVSPRVVDLDLRKDRDADILQQRERDLYADRITHVRRIDDLAVDVDDTDGP